MAGTTPSWLLGLVLELRLGLKSNESHSHLSTIAASLLMLLKVDVKTHLPEALQESLKINHPQQTPLLFHIIWGFGDCESL